MKKIIMSLLFILLIIPLYGKIYGKNLKLAIKYYKIANKYYKMKSYKRAMYYYKHAINKYKKFSNAWFGLGLCYYKLKKYTNAKIAFKYSYILNPKNKLALKYYNYINKRYKKSKNKKKHVRITPKTKGDLMWRSALLPGWGQFYNGETIKGYMYLLGFVISIGATAKYIFDQQEAVTSYEQTNYNFDEKYKQAEDATMKVYIPLGVSAVIWGLSIFDAYLSGKDNNFKSKKNVYFKIDKGSYIVAFNILNIEY